jgi:hypothetical protein
MKKQTMLVPEMDELSTVLFRWRRRPSQCLSHPHQHLASLRPFYHNPQFHDIQNDAFFTNCVSTINGNERDKSVVPRQRSKKHLL